MPQASLPRFRPSLLLVVGVAVAILLGRPTAPVQAAAGDPAPVASLYEVPLRFVNDAGTRLELSTLRGRQVILTMFYARCRSACPTTLGKLRQIDKAFAERGRPIEIVLVSYDSDFDHPKALARFRDREKLPPQWHLLSGSDTQVQRLADLIGLGRYLDMGDHIFHAYRIVLLDEAGVVRKALDSHQNKISSLFEEGASGDLRSSDAHP